MIAPAIVPLDPVQGRLDQIKQRVSASRLNTFHQCRLKFFFRYILQLKKQKTPALHVGTTVHGVLRAWNKARWRKEPMDVEGLRQVFARLWVEEQEKETVRWDGSETEEMESAWRVLEKYFRESPISSSDKPEAVEVEVQADLSHHGLPQLVGIIDLVYRGSHFPAAKSLRLISPIRPIDDQRCLACGLPLTRRLSPCSLATCCNMITRKIGRILRGDATPFQLMMACTLAGLLGFMPGLVQAPGLILVFTFSLILVNANLALAALIGIAAKIASLLLMPVSFQVGRFLLDGPTRPLFESMINAPVLAFFGFEYYASTGGLVLGLAWGIATGLVVTAIVQRFRRKIVQLHRESERFQKFISKGWVKVGTFLLFSGGATADQYEQILAKRVGNPIRPLGLVFVLVLGTFLSTLYLFASGPIVVMALQSGLERANGATVDIQDAELSLTDNRLTIAGLSLADPDALQYDRFRAERLEADINTADLLRKRLRIDHLLVRDGSYNQPRVIPGTRIGEEPIKPPIATEPVKPSAGKSIDDYLNDAKLWRERLEQAERWLEKISGDSTEHPDSTPPEKRETLRQRLEREIRERGYANVIASHLLEPSPALIISEVTAEKVRTSQFPDETLDVTGRNLSTDPHLLAEAPELQIRSSADSFSFELMAGALKQSPSDNLMTLSCRGISSDVFTKKLLTSNSSQLQGGTLDITGKGVWRDDQGIWIDMPINVAIRDATVTIPELEPTKVDELELAIGLRGRLLNPEIDFDSQQFAEAIAKAAKSAAVTEAKRRVQQKATDELNAQLEKNEKLRGVKEALGNQPKQLIEGFLKRKSE